MRHTGVHKTSRRLISSLTLILGILFAATGSLFAAPPTDEKPIYIVQLADRPGAADLAVHLAAQNRALHLYRHVFHGFAAELSDTALQALQQNPNVEKIEQAFTVHANAETYPTGVDRIDADQVHGTWEGYGARVAIVDTGIDFSHPDLAGQVDTGLSRTFISRGKTTADGLDDHGHGTHVAGTVAAVRGNNLGVIGVAPQAQLIALKVLNKNGSGSTVDIIAALDYITGYNNARSDYAEIIHIANFSLGGSGSDSDTSFRRAFDRTVASGCFIAVAAGNESDDAANHVPAAYDSVFTVSAMDPLTDQFASFSNYGSDIDIAAPGVAINSTVPGGGYASWKGTSMATPHVAGAAALYVGQKITTLTKAGAESAIRTALIGSGEAITFAGDPDGIHEPLLDAEAVLGPIAPPADAIAITVTTDQPSYADTDLSATLTVQVRDEFGDPVAGLTADDFDLGGYAFSFSDDGGGTYSLTLDIAGWGNDVDYPVTVTVSSGNLSDSDVVTIRKATAKTIYISSIVYDQVFKNLRGYLTVSDLDNRPVANATIDLTLKLDGQDYKAFSITTAGNGVADFRVGNARPGHYTMVIIDVTAAGAMYVESLNVPDPEYDVQ